MEEKFHSTFLKIADLERPRRSSSLFLSFYDGVNYDPDCMRDMQINYRTKTRLLIQCSLFHQRTEAAVIGLSFSWRFFAS